MTDLGIAAKIAAIAAAIGFDTIAISIAVGMGGVSKQAAVRVGVAFATAEVVMQALGFWLGSGLGAVVGTIAPYAGFAVLFAIGVWTITGSLHGRESEKRIKLDSLPGMVGASLAISLDSLGIGFSLPGVPVPLVPLLITVACTTLVFTVVGIWSGTRLGERFEQRAELTAGSVLILLAIVFTVQHLIAGRAPNGGFA